MKVLSRNNIENSIITFMYKIHYFKFLSSTQDKAKEFSKKGLGNVVIIADVQTKGRGRFKRKWHSSKNGLWMSILIKLKNAERLQYLTFIASISVVKAIKKICGLKTSIKWPNDVNYEKKKLCGILTEGIFGKENFATVGIGLNVNQTKFPADIKNMATSLRMIKRRLFSTKKISRCILDEFFNLYENYYSKSRFSEILEIWKKYCDTIGKDVTALTVKRKLHGKAIGIDKDCNLLLKSKNGSIIKITEGDIKIRY